MTQDAVQPVPGSPTLQDTQQLRRWHRWRWVSWFIVVLVVLATLIFTGISWFLHQVVVPRSEEYRPKLEQQASQILGVPVRIGAIVVKSGGWIPSFELQQVTLLNEAGQVALALPKVTAAVSARSLMLLGFEQIHIEAPVLEVRRDAAGRIRVAGLIFGDASVSGSHKAADWFFSQPEFVIRQGTLHWVDDLRQAPPITLSQVDLVIRNPGVQHHLRLDATPPVQWGDRFTVQGDFEHAWLETQEGDWRRWTGQAYAQFGRVDVSELRRYTQLGINVQQGRGALRLWSDLTHGEVTNMTADVALEEVNVTLSPKLLPLELRTLTGRIGGALTDDGFEFYTEKLQFVTHDGIQWSGGNVFASQKKGRLTGQAKGQLRADKLDLATLAQIANRLPLGEAPHRWLTQLAPKGVIEAVNAQWTGAWDDPKTWSVKGRVSGIEVATQTATERPGVKGLAADFDVTQAGGQARLAMRQGVLVLPGVFEEPAVGMNELDASVRWSVKGAWPDVDVVLDVDRFRFSNADAQGVGAAHWRTRDSGGTGARFPGVLELDVVMDRADGARVYRYLPLGIPKVTRDYVKEAVIKGRADEVKFRVKGDLRDFPFSSGQGEFRIQARVADTVYAYVPTKAGKDNGWPALTGLTGQLIFDRSSMEVKAASSGVQGTRQLQTSKVQALIADLAHPVVVVQGDIRGPLAEMLEVVKQSPLSAMTNGVLSGAGANGDATTRLQLELPLAKIDASKVQGTLTLPGNDVRVTADTPPLSKAKGQVVFSEAGFQINGTQARFLGGDMKLEGGTVKRAASVAAHPNDQTILLKAQGQASAQGLREAKELGMVSQLAKGATGSLSYVASLGFRRGRPEMVVSSSMVGVALNLPQPMVKTAEASLPLRYEQVVRKDSMGVGQALQDSISLDVGQLATIDIVRDVSSSTPKVLRGAIGVGLPRGQELPMPSDGIAASIVFDTMDLDAWDRVFQPSPGVTAAPVTPSSGSATAPAYWPNAMVLRARVLTLAGRQFNRVVVGGTREGLNWRANMDADELNGYVEFRQAQGNIPGNLYARLTRLSLGAATASEIENVLDQQPTTVPALDVVVEDLEYKGKKLGRVEMDATNLGRGSTREWRLRKLNVSLPEANFQASGNWTRVSEAATERLAARRSAMKFKLDIQDSGALLRRFGMGDLVRKTPGVMEGQVSWTGSPLALDYPSMHGQFNVEMKEGQFLKVDPGAARLLGVLSLQALPRRLALDFRDVFSEGFAFDNIRGDVSIENGIAKTNNLQMKGVVAGVLMEGTANLAQETQDLRVVVVPEINAGTASLFAAAVNPVIGLGTFLAQAIIRRPLIKQNTEEFRVEGSWADPKVTKVSHKEDGSSAPAQPTSAASPQ